MSQNHCSTTAQVCQLEAVDDQEILGATQDQLGDEWPEYCRMRLQTFVDTLRLSSGRAWGWAGDERLTCAVILPRNFVSQWHVQFVDPVLIAKARVLIRAAYSDGMRVCEDDPSAVLVLCPVQ